MDDAYSWSAFYCDADHACHLVQAALSESLCAIDCVDPNSDILSKKFFSVGTRGQIHRGHRLLILHHLLQLFLVIFCLLAALLCRLLEKARGQEGTISSLK